MNKFKMGDFVSVPGHSECVVLGYDECSERGQVLWVGWCEEDEVSVGEYSLDKIEMLVSNYCTNPLRSEITCDMLVRDNEVLRERLAQAEAKVERALNILDHTLPGYESALFRPHLRAALSDKV